MGACVSVWVRANVRVCVRACLCGCACVSECACMRAYGVGVSVAHEQPGAADVAPKQNANEIAHALDVGALKSKARGVWGRHTTG